MEMARTDMVDMMQRTADVQDTMTGEDMLYMRGSTYMLVFVQVVQSFLRFQ